MIQVYTGDGKGKTTAALGLALRAIGHGLNVAVLQFLKDDPEYGEFKARTQLKNFELYQVGRNDFVNFKQPDKIDLELAASGWAKAKELIAAGRHQIIILDEFTFVLKYNLLDAREIYEFLSNHKNTCEIIITGRYATPELIELADLVTDMHNVKHYFDKNIESRKGIDH